MLTITPAAGPVRDPQEWRDLTEELAERLQTHPQLRRRAKVVEEDTQICHIDFMKRDESISRLQQHEADLRRLGVEHLYVFGSTARGDAKDVSDVDLFFD